MIDSLYARYSQQKIEPLDPTYTPQHSIRGRVLVNAHSDKLAVIFPGWHMHKFPTNNLVKRLTKQGWAVLLYDFNNQILEPNDEIVAESFEFIQKQVAVELDKLVKEHGYRQVHFVGISLGNVAMALVADSFPKFNSATVVVGGENLAVDMWHGLRTLYIRDAFLKAQIGMRKLNKDWTEEAPQNHVKNFGNKPVTFVLSRADKIILAKYQWKLLGDLKKAGAQVNLKKRYGGHLMTIARFCLIDTI